jgi:hypothetical protein
VSAVDCMSNGSCVATGGLTGGPATAVNGSPNEPNTPWTVTPASTIQSLSS